MLPFWVIVAATSSSSHCYKAFGFRFGWLCLVHAWEFYAFASESSKAITAQDTWSSLHKFTRAVPPGAHGSHRRSAVCDELLDQAPLRLMRQPVS